VGGDRPHAWSCLRIVHNAREQLAQLDQAICSWRRRIRRGAGRRLSYNVIDESQLKNISNLIGYDTVRRPETVQRNLRPFNGKLP
jgi:hypothetical protein